MVDLPSKTVLSNPVGCGPGGFASGTAWRESTLRRNLQRASRAGASSQPGVRFVAVNVDGALRTVPDLARPEFRGYCPASAGSHLNLTGTGRVSKSA